MKHYKIYDCFCYFNEDMLLKIRLETLWDNVDIFVISEANYSHKGDNRKTQFDISKFSKYAKNKDYVGLRDAYRTSLRKITIFVVLIAIIFILLSIINEFCGLMAKVISGERRYDGPMGKSDRAFLIGIICIIYYFTNGLDPYMNYIIGGSSVMIILSSYVRLIKSIKNGKNNK